MDTGLEASTPSPSSSSSVASTKKRPAGRTKFRETRHPVYRGVRSRGNAERWVCEVRVPGKRGARLWLGTYATAEIAARANDAAMLALGGRSAARLNFADSAWLLAVPSAHSDLADVRRAAVEAVADLQRREAARGSITATVAEEASSGASAQSSSESDDAGSLEMWEPSADGEFDVPAAMDNDMFFRLDFFPEMESSYYVSLAEALLMDPPPTASSTDEYWDYGDGGADVALWSY